MNYHIHIVYDLLINQDTFLSDLSLNIYIPKGVKTID